MGLAFGACLMAERIKRGLSRYDLAKKVPGISSMYVWKMETGKAVPTIYSFKRLLDALNFVSPEDSGELVKAWKGDLSEEQIQRLKKHIKKLSQSEQNPPDQTNPQNPLSDRIGLT